MLELKRDLLQFAFPDVHPEAKFDVAFQRTLRIPDDGKTYPLPPGLGNFPLRAVDDFKDRVPARWIERGGVMFPMYQSEALWLSFTTHGTYQRDSYYPMAIKVATGKISAVTGNEWTPGLKAKDYLVAPLQPWLDGYAVGDGLIRQFVAAPLGWGFSAEEQITGKADHGGLQIEVIPMKADVYERRFPKLEMVLDMERSVCMDFAPDMSLAPGGKMKQQIHEDPYDINDWDVERGSRVFVHLANSLVWEAITGHAPPSPTTTAAAYTRHGLPWFEHYVDDAKTLKGSGKLASLKSVLAMGFQKGLGILPENASAEIKIEAVKQLADKPRSPHEVREGNW